MEQEKLKFTTEQIKAGREHIAALARADDEIIFAAEVLAGCWDHRNDVARAIAGERFKTKGE